MFKKLLINKLKKTFNKFAIPAVLYAENLIGSGFGETKKQIALDFIINRLPVCLLPFRGIIGKILADLLDFVIEEGVKKLHSMQNKIPEAL